MTVLAEGSLHIGLKYAHFLATKAKYNLSEDTPHPPGGSYSEKPLRQTGARYQIATNFLAAYGGLLLLYITISFDINHKNSSESEGFACPAEA